LLCRAASSPRLIRPKRIASCSPNRAKRIREEIEQRLGSQATHVGTETETPEQMVKQAKQKREQGAPMRTSAPHAVLAGVHGGAGFAVGFAAALGLALVPVLLAFGHGQLALHPPMAEVEPGGDERVALDLRLGE